MPSCLPSFELAREAVLASRDPEALRLIRLSNEHRSIFAPVKKEHAFRMVADEDDYTYLMSLYQSLDRNNKEALKKLVNSRVDLAEYIIGTMKDGSSKDTMLARAASKREQVKAVFE